ncbi:MAG: PD40 domain-containing protein [Planctomycetes bacterium]|nr:PD40 domain-containing protein [Planctomycetota bacterium]MBI3843989.1 PD40 domain-containing protein [Planctomycetota bacterium]
MARRELTIAAAGIALSVTCGTAVAQSTTRASVATNGDESNGYSYLASITPDGRYVVFSSDAQNLVPGGIINYGNLFVRDRESGVTTLDSVDSGGAPFGVVAYATSISADGRYLVFEASGGDKWIRDRVAASSILIGRVTGFTNEHPTISGDGRFVVFQSDGDYVVPGDTNHATDVFVYDRDADGNGLFDEPGYVMTHRVSVNATGAQANRSSWLGLADGKSISEDGRFVVFSSYATNLAGSDTNDRTDIFVHDDVSGGIVRVSVGSAGEEANGSSDDSSISSDGRFVVFSSVASNLVPNDTNGVADVFWHDLMTGSTQRVSLTHTGNQLGTPSSAPRISPGGRYVAFESADAFVVSNDRNGVGDVFVRDMELGFTRRVSVDSSGNEGNGISREASLSSSGRFVAFAGGATNLVPSDTNDSWDVFVRDARFDVWLLTPPTGSESGGEHVRLVGPTFAPANDSRIFFGEREAEIVDAAAGQLIVRTPPGRGTVSVSIFDAAGEGTAPVAYRYVSPGFAVRYGNVGAGLASREDVLLVNGAPGDDVRREAGVAIGDPFEVTLRAPSTRGVARFVLYGWMGAPDPAAPVSLPRGLGAMVFPPPFVGPSPQLRAIFNNLGFRRVLGSPTLASQPAPSTVLRRARGFRSPATITFQGLIEDSASASAAGISVTNSVILSIR